MTEQEFQREMMKAKTFSELGDRVNYWQGYQRGLRQKYHGEKFGTLEEHEKWLSLVDDLDIDRQERGRGYQDGFKK